MHGRQDRMSKSDAQYQNQHPCGKAEDHSGMYGFLQIFMVSGTDIKCGKRIDTTRESYEQTGKQCD